MRELRVIDLASGQPRTLFKVGGASWPLYPSWSPEGRQVVVQHTRGIFDPYRIVVVSLADGSSREVAQSVGAWTARPHSTPFGFEPKVIYARRALALLHEPRRQARGALSRALRGRDAAQRDGVRSGPAAPRPVPGGTVRLDGGGRYAIPEIFDAHVHSAWSNQQTNEDAFIAFGVTSVRDTGATLDLLTALDDRSTHTALAAPRYFYSGEICCRWLRRRVKRSTLWRPANCSACPAVRRRLLASHCATFRCLNNSLDRLWFGLGIRSPDFRAGPWHNYRERRCTARARTAA